jgi:hypothetical protein
LRRFSFSGAKGAERRERQEGENRVRREGEIKSRRERKKR